MTKTNQKVERRSFLKTVGVSSTVAALAGCNGVDNSETDDEPEGNDESESDVQSETDEFTLLETSIAEIHDAMEREELSAEDLTEQYLSRIDAYNEDLNAIITVNPDAEERASDLDAEFEASGPVGPLHGIPIILKDNVNTEDLPTSSGNVLFEETVPPADAFITEQLREAGGIILAKANMGEFASGGLSSLGGQARNPYDTAHSTGGSSAGSGVAMAANLGTISIGTETWGSILSPSTKNSLVGIQPTTGLISRDGIAPLSETLDSAGPITRNVADAAQMLDVIAGYDPADQRTAEGAGHIPDASYTDFLNEEGLSDARLGIPRALIQDDPEETGAEVGQPLQVANLFDEAVEDLESAGARIVDPVEIPSDTKELAGDIGIPIIINEFKRDFTAYLDNLGDAAPVEDMEEILDSETIEGSILGLFESAVEADIDATDEGVEYLRAIRDQRLLRNGILSVMRENELDAIIYPTDNRTPAMIEGSRDPPDTLSPSPRTLSPIPNLPSITIPAGYTEDPDLPVGLSFLGPQYSEPRLIELGYSYEQRTELREIPAQYGGL